MNLEPSDRAERHDAASSAAAGTLYFTSPETGPTAPAPASTAKFFELVFRTTPSMSPSSMLHPANVLESG